MTPAATTYLNEALDYIQGHSLMREHIDWLAVRQEATTLAAQAQNPSETYPAIRRTLELLGDGHSTFIDPAAIQLRKEEQLRHLGLQGVHPTGYVGVVYPGSPAEQAGIRAGDRLETINDRPISALTKEQFRKALEEPQVMLTYTPAEGKSLRSVHLEAAPFVSNRQPHGHRLANDLGYLAVPEVLNMEASKVFAGLAHQIIREIDQTPTAGWVIDLRTNGGGSLWPMLVGVGPIVGEGECLGLAAPHEKLDVLYRGGRAWVEQQQHISASVDEPYALKRPWPPVAVLTSQITASAAEFVALAFRGRPHSRSFGEPTRGVPTSNYTQELSDGAFIALTTHMGADRTGQTYDGPLLPDEPVMINWTQLGTPDDPVLQAAIRWLQTETGSH